MSQKNKRLIVIGGPTASGKTDLAVQLAQYFNTAILSADSRQCYKELNIGVAKPDKQLLELVKHYFIDTHTIHEEVTAGTYERYGLQVLNEIFATQDTAICVGGTGLYIKALCEGLDDMPAVDTGIKESVELLYERNGMEWLRNEVKKADPTFYAQADSNNPMRLLRALIFYETHKKSILSFQSKQARNRFFDIDYYAIDIDRQNLYKNISNRVDAMMEAGLLNEVEALQPYQHIKALQTVGYKELFNYFNGDWSLEMAVEKIKQHTRNYAKRQITWFSNQGPYQMHSVHDIMRKFVIRK